MEICEHKVKSKFKKKIIVIVQQKYYMHNEITGGLNEVLLLI